VRARCERGNAADRRPQHRLAVVARRPGTGAALEAHHPPDERTAKRAALAQARKPTRRGTTLWVETDGTVYWSVPETAIPTHGDGANRKDNKFIRISRPIGAW
jgi:hypothetical protein